MIYTILYYIVFIIGYLCVFLPPVIARANNKKLSAKDFTLQVSLPVSIGLLFVLGGYYTMLREETDEFKLTTLISVTAIGGIAFSLMAACLSIIRIRWAAD